METRVEITEEVVKSACVLHNFIQKEETFNYFHGDDVDDDDASDFRCSNTGLTPTRSNRSTRETTAVRNALKDYFVSPVGAIEWQERQIAISNAIYVILFICCPKVILVICSGYLLL
jgi:hypothetical protein